MTYAETIDYLYSRTPQFQQIGAAAYKPGLDTVEKLAAAFDNPQRSYKIIHVGGTNGKGSTSHTIAAVLQAAGYKVGLYTSPHLIDFRERMRVNGEVIPEEDVCSFVERYCRMPLAATLAPSFFELTTVMAFDWFSRSNVDVAVIEVGLGGRLDSTNIVDSCLSVLTNVSFDHIAQLGNTLKSIAGEKAGIMRRGVACVCGETNPEIKGYFLAEAGERGVPIEFADELPLADSVISTGDSIRFEGTSFGTLDYALTGDCQMQNGRTVLAALGQLAKLGFVIPKQAVAKGFAEVCTMTGLMGRWMRLSDNPTVICDTGHNIGGWELLSGQLKRLPRPLTVVLGFVNDKNIAPILPLLPTDARYIFTNAAIPRALPATELRDRAREFGLVGECVPDVAQAYRYALSLHPANDASGAVFVGGSTFVVADLLKHLSAVGRE